MPSASRTITINSPSDEVFRFFSTPDNDPRWRPHVKEIGAAGEPAVGSRIHQVIAGPGGRGIPADIEVTAYEPSTRYAFKVTAGPARPVGEFQFAPNGPATDLTFTLDAAMSGIKKLLMSRSVQKSMEAEMASLDTAKRLMETP
jgi:uncharacterized protein YndB with AHSA1/START domain